MEKMYVSIRVCILKCNFYKQEFNSLPYQGNIKYFSNANYILLMYGKNI